MYTAVVLAAILSVCVAAKKGLVPILEDRIVGGEETTIEKYPHQISLLYLGAHNCGGSIISKTMVITAVECVYGRRIELLKIRAGTTFMNESGVDVSVKTIHIHEKFNSELTDFDISILMLAESLIFSPKIQPIAMPIFGEDIAEGTSVYVSGWGVTQEGGMEPYHLKVVEMNIIGYTKCYDAYTKDKITANMICAGKPNGSSGVCQGFAGGPMIVFDQNNKTKLIGIVSWVNGCLRPGFPGVYAKISALRNWIRDKTNL